MQAPSRSAMQALSRSLLPTGPSVDSDLDSPASDEPCRVSSRSSSLVYRLELRLSLRAAEVPAGEQTYNATQRHVPSGGTGRVRERPAGGERTKLPATNNEPMRVGPRVRPRPDNGPTTARHAAKTLFAVTAAANTRSGRPKYQPQDHRKLFRRLGSDCVGRFGQLGEPHAAAGHPQGKFPEVSASRRALPCHV